MRVRVAPPSELTCLHGRMTQLYPYPNVVLLKYYPIPLYWLVVTANSDLTQCDGPIWTYLRKK